MGWISEVTPAGRTEGRVNWSKMFLGFWPVDGEALAKVGTPAEDQLDPVGCMLKLKCP